MTTDRPANEDHIREYERLGPVRLGIMSSHVWRIDPKRVMFTLSRYKFVAKMLSGCAEVLEVGCGDGFGTPIVLQEVGKLHGVDIEPAFIEDCLHNRESDRATFAVADLTREALAPPRDAAFSLDVLEHIGPGQEDYFMRNLAASIVPDGICIIGAPSLESQAYASPWSRMEHVNCKTGPDLREFCRRWFRTVFLFSMNDEMVHTGFSPLAHYLFCVCVGRKA